MSHSSAVWIGLNDLAEEGTFRWASNNQLLGSWNDWMPDKPNNIGGNEHCTLLYHEEPDQKWNDVPCGIPIEEPKTLCEE